MQGHLKLMYEAPNWITVSWTMQSQTKACIIMWDLHSSGILCSIQW